ncbi:MAG: cytochrome c-type biogenesis protein [Pseudomonadota bacterium]
MRGLLTVVLLTLSVAAFAAIGVYEFETPEQEARFKRLSEELRCLVCQNQNLADSNAGLALDLRRQVHTMILAGKSDADIISFMTERYGDFVLYRPPLHAGTLLLWSGPFVLLLLGVVVLGRVVRQRTASAAADDAPLTTAEQQRLEQMLRQQQGEKE